MKEHTCSLKLAYHQAEQDYREVFDKLTSARRSKGQAAVGNGINHSKMRMSHNPKHRGNQIRCIQKLHKDMREIDRLENALDNAKLKSDEAKWDLGLYTLWAIGLYDQYCDDFDVKTRKNSDLINIFPCPRDEINHGHYILDVEKWVITCHRDVGETRGPWNSTVYELSFG